MTNNKTFNDTQILSEAKEKLALLEKKYEESNNDEKNEIFKEIMDYRKKITQAEKRMIKRIKKVIVLNEYETAKRSIYSTQLRILSKHLNLEDNASKAVSKPIEAISDFTGGFFPLTIFFGVPIALVSIPIILGFLVVATGINLGRLLPYIHQNKKLKLELESTGMYDKIVDFLKENNIEEFELGDNYYDSSYKNFLVDEFGYGRKR